MIKIDYETLIRGGFLGRNGLGNTKGLEISKTSKTIMLSPVTSKNEVARCYIEIPIDSLAEFIKALEEIQ